MNTNHTNCVCLNTLNLLYEINEHVGEVLPINNCTTNALEIYSLTKDPYILPLPTTKNDDWSLEGCYRLDSFQGKPANISSTGTNHTKALDSCEKYCQTILKTNYSSFFFSFKKFCFCQPIKPSINTTAIRIPLVYCSSLPYIKKAFNNSFNESSVHVDTVVKILVQRYCSSSFIFDRKLYLCSKTVLSNQLNSYSRITPNDSCSSISVKTIEQYNHLISLSRPSPSRTFIWINRNSSYLFDYKFKSKVNSLPSEELCLVTNQKQSPPSDLVACSTATKSSDYIFCVQKPIETNDNKQSELKSMYV
jgi:hypothetical protein